MLCAERPDVINPPAIVRAAFDEERALAEIRAAVERRDEAKGEHKEATVLLGQKFAEARRAMPGDIRFGKEKYSEKFKAFVAKTGLSLYTAQMYMGFYRNPERLKTHRVGSSYSARRRRVLAEVQALLAESPDLETARRVIAEELNELTAQAPASHG